MRECFPKPKPLGANVKAELDLSNYVTEADLENAACVDTSGLAQKTDLTNLKFDKLDINELENVPSNLSDLKSKVDKLDADE